MELIFYLANKTKILQFDVIKLVQDLMSSSSYLSYNHVNHTPTEAHVMPAVWKQPSSDM